MTGRSFRPSFGDRISPEEIARRASEAKKLSDQKVAQAHAAERRKVYDVLMQSLPLLEGHVEKSPVETHWRLPFMSSVFTKVDGGWPITSRRIRIPIRDGDSIRDGFLNEHLVLTDTHRFGYAMAVKDRNTFEIRGSNPPRITLANITEFEDYTDKLYGNPRGPDAPTGFNLHAIQMGIERLMHESGVEQP